MDGGTTFHFVGDGIEDAVARARDAAGEADVSIGGGTLRQAIAAGLLDEIVVHRVPIPLGDGERLFDDLAPGAAEFALTAVVEGPEALHLRYSLSPGAAAT